MDATEMTNKAQNWQENAEDLKDQAGKWSDTVTQKAQDTGRVIHDYVQENTWMSVAIAAAVGCAIGLLLSRGRD